MTFPSRLIDVARVRLKGFYICNTSCSDNLCIRYFQNFLVMSLVQIKVEYEYYSEKRITTLYMNEEDILIMTHDDFKSRILEDVPHLNKMTSLRITIRDDGLEVDLSPTYFCHQIKGVLSKDKTNSIRDVEFNSPIVFPGEKKNDKYSVESIMQSRVRRSSQLHSLTNESLLLSSQTSSSTNDIQKSPPISTPWKGTR